MTFSIGRVAAAVLGLMLSFAAAPLCAEELIGTWRTEQGEAHIRVARCGQQICGTVVWLRDPIDPKTQQPQADSNNPDPNLRSRPIIGLRIFTMSRDATGSWTGNIYNSDDGQMYKGRLSPRGENEMEVHGCAGSLCGSEVWTRVGK